MKHAQRRITKALALLLSPTLLFFSLTTQAAPPLPGAIFTTTVDGSRVNANLYEAKEDVYLDGGPGPNAPSTAAALPEGDYYFQVTDPSGKDLLSSDHISCRRIHVNAEGVIDTVYAGTNYVKEKGQWAPVLCQHYQGLDIDHNAATVQLYPYDDTPNPGGVYKVWITRVEDYDGDPNFIPTSNKDSVNGELWQPANAHGFIPSKSKTDNYKVKKKGKPFISPVIDVVKFHDRNANGIQDDGEEFITGWQVTVTEPIGVSNYVYTPASIEAAEAGIWNLTEATPDGTMQTVSTLDGNTVSLYPTADPSVDVDVQGVSEEHHQVVYGNVGLGHVVACKVYDRNANGVADGDESGIAGWRIDLAGTTVTGTTVSTTQTTGADGCTTFVDLLPGNYTVTEVMPTAGNWQATGDTSYNVTVESTLDGSSVSGGSYSVTFTNVCFDVANFDTKGYWHNKNGLSELTDADIAYVNVLDPYDSETTYFGDGDEPFDGVFSDGTPVSASLGNSGEEIAPPGSWQAEVSQFLVDSNGDGGQQEQLAQQLLAFIFNSLHRLDDPTAGIQLPDGSSTSAATLVGDAIAAWQGSDQSAWTYYSSLLDGFNNNDAVNYVPATPCAVIY